MAKYIADGIKLSSHFNVDLTDIEHILLGELEEKIVRSDAIIIGSPTINQNILMQVYKMFALINPIRDRGKLAAAFGSYGWSGEAVGIIQNHLKQLKLNVMEVDMKAKFFPYNEKAIQLIEFGKNIADQLKQNQNSVK
jgi:flavorubredoxin